MTYYTLTSEEAARYDSDDDRESRGLIHDLIQRFGPVNPAGTTEVSHPDGFVVDVFGE